MSGTVKFGNYELERRVARGDVSEVFLAREPEGEGIDSIAVVRRVLPARAGNQEFVKRFLEEAELAARLDHPNIVQINDVGEIDGAYFVATEYVPGGSLSELVRRRGEALAPEDACLIVAEVCSGLQFAHSLAGPDGAPLGAVHGDLSPKNVIVSVDGVVKVVDFGLSKAWARFGAAPDSDMPGAYSHLAPELALGGTVDRRTDVYACGALLYFLITGEPAFPEATDAGSTAGRAGGPRPPRELDEELPEELEAIVLKAMAEAPKDRYPTCGSMKRALNDTADSLWLQCSVDSVAALVKGAFPDVVDVTADRASLPGEPVEGGAFVVPPPAVAAGSAAPTVAEDPLADAAATAAASVAAVGGATVADDGPTAPPPTLAEEPPPAGSALAETTPAPVAPASEPQAAETTPAPVAAPPATVAEEGAAPPPLAVAAAAAAAAEVEEPDGTMALVTSDLEPVLAEKQKKSYLGLILLIVGGVLLLLGGAAVAAWLFFIPGEIEDYGDQGLASYALDPGSTTSTPGIAPGLTGVPGYGKAVAVPPPAGMIPGGDAGVGGEGDKPPDEPGALASGALDAGLGAAGDASVLGAVADGAAPEAPPSEKVASPTGASRPSGEASDRPAGKGYLSVLTTPFSKVYMDGRLLGTTPILKRTVPAGSHTLRLVNPEVPTKRVRVRIRRNQLTQVRHNLWPTNRGNRGR